MVMMKMCRKDTLQGPIGSYLRYIMRESLFDTRFCDGRKGRFTQLALALQSDIMVSQFDSLICPKDFPGAHHLPGVLESISPTCPDSSEDGLGGNWTLNVSLYHYKGNLQYTGTVSQIFDCVVDFSGSPFLQDVY